MENITFFTGNNQEEIHGIGLIFGPNFFTVYFYSDSDGSHCIGFSTFSRSELGRVTDWKHHTPIYAFTFKEVWTLIPEDIFKEEHLDTYLEFNTSHAGENLTDWHRVMNIDGVVCFEQDREASQAVLESFPGLALRHGIVPLIAFDRATRTGGVHADLTQYGHSYTLIIFRDDQLIFANSILGKHIEDVLYFVLYTFDQLDVSNETPFRLLGEAIKNENLIKSLGLYLSELEVQTEHEHWLGKNAATCAL